MDFMMKDEPKTEDSLVYRQAYPKEITKERIARLKRQGIAVCPYCGSEMIRAGESGHSLVCLRCGRSFRGNQK